MGDMPMTDASFPIIQEKKKRDPNQSLLTFLKIQGVLVELTPLNSKARAQGDRKLIKDALKHWFVPTDLIREYYGD